MIFLFVVLSILFSSFSIKATHSSDSNLKELFRNAIQLMKNFQQNKLTSNVAQRIETELKAMEQTRIKALNLAERLESHRRIILGLQDDLFSRVGEASQERMLYLQMLMDKKDQVEKTFSNILKIFQNTQRDLVVNLK